MCRVCSCASARPGVKNAVQATRTGHDGGDEGLAHGRRRDGLHFQGPRRLVAATFGGGRRARQRRPVDALAAADQVHHGHRRQRLHRHVRRQVAHHLVQVLLVAVPEREP